MTETRDERVLQTFATLADTMIAGYDVVDLLQKLVDSCQTLLDVPAAGLLLGDSLDNLDLVASTSEAAGLVKLLQLSGEEGLGATSFDTGEVVSVPDLEVADGSGRFEDAALQLGFRSAHAIPLRLRDVRIGALIVLGRDSGSLPGSGIVAAQALADVATIGILHERALRESAIVSEQLQAALNSRVVIEQAKGVVSHTQGVPIDRAFEIIREYARSHQLGIGAVAAALVDRTLRLEAPRDAPPDDPAS